MYTTGANGRCMRLVDCRYLQNKNYYRGTVIDVGKWTEMLSGEL